MGKKLTHEEFIEKLKCNNQHFANNEIDIVGEYVNTRSYIECKCNICEHIWVATGKSLLSGRGCRKCGRKIASEKHNLSHEQFLKRVEALNSGLSAIDEYVNSKTKVKMRCALGHVWDASPQHLFDGVGCPYCGGLKVWVGFNDLWTTRPDIAELLKNPNDGYKYSKASYKKVAFLCPNCGNEINKKISDVYTDGLACKMCSDGVSYPNKFGRAFLCQLPINNLSCEYSPYWARPYFYDNYFQYKGINYILEMDGGFHYIESSLSNVPLTERKKIDAIKDDLAIQNNMKLIRIDCLKSDKEYISNNICNSELKDIFDLSIIDWDLCDKKAQKSLVKESCDLYISGLYDLSTIANMLHISVPSVRLYIKKGKNFGWC